MTQTNYRDGHLIGCKSLVVIAISKIYFGLIFPVLVVRFIAIAYLDACNNNPGIVLRI